MAVICGRRRRFPVSSRHPASRASPGPPSTHSSPPSPALRRHTAPSTATPTARRLPHHRTTTAAHLRSVHGARPSLRVRFRAVLWIRIQIGSVFRTFVDPDFDLDLDPNWANIQDPDPNSMYLDPQHCLKPCSGFCVLT